MDSREIYGLRLDYIWGNRGGEGVKDEQVSSSVVMGDTHRKAALEPCGWGSGVDPGVINKWVVREGRRG